MEFYHVVHTKGASGEPHHGAEVTSAAAQVQEGKARLQVQGLHQLRGDARKREVDVAVLPRQVFTCVL